MAFKTLGWDIMDKAYNNPNFNKYEEGPGGELDDHLQPGAIARSGKCGNKIPIALHLRNVPAELDETGIRNLCGKFGTIIDVKRFPSTAIVNCLNLGGAENILKKVNDMSELGITVTFARNRDSATNSINNSINNSDKNLKSPNRNSDSELNMRNRNIKGLFNKPTKITIEQKKPMITDDDYINGRLQYTDPHKNYCGEKDSRFGRNHIMNSGHVSNGREHYKESPELLTKMKKLSLASNGQYDSETNTYTYRSQGTDLEFPTVGPCIVCANSTDKTCQRCGEFYCSVTCQKRDWPTHRPICFPMPKLVSRQQCVSSNIQNFGENNHKSLNQNNVSNDEDNYEGKSKNNNSKTENIKKTTINSGSNQRSKISDRIIQNQSKNNATTITTLPESSRSIDTKPPITDLSSKSLSKKKSDDHRNNSSCSNNKNNVQQCTNKQSNQQATQILEYVAPPKSKSNVTITSVKDHRTYYIRSKSPEDDENYVKIINDITEYAMTAKSLTKRPEKGDIVVALYEGDFYRAIVLKSNDTTDEINVAFIDYGNVEVKSLSDLRELSWQLQQRKCFTFKIILHNVPNILSNDSIMTYLHNLVENGIQVRINYDGIFGHSNDTVDLFDIENQESITKYITDLNVIPKAQLSDEIIYMEDIQMKLLSGKNLEVVVVDNSLLFLGFISVVKREDLEELESNNNRFQEYCEKNTEVYTPRKNEICLVKYPEDNKWYRASCIKVVGDGRPTVTFIDYGNQGVISIENIRKLPREFAFPCITVSCSIDEIEEANEKLLDRLKELIPSNELLTIENCESLDDTGEHGSLIYLPKIIDKLKQEKLL